MAQRNFDALGGGRIGILKVKHGRVRVWWQAGGERRRMAWRARACPPCRSRVSRSGQGYIDVERAWLPVPEYFGAQASA